MNFYQFNKLLKNTCVSHKLVNEFQNGDIYTNLNSGQHKYPCLNLTVQTLNDVNDSITNCSFTLFYVDRLLDNNANTLEIQSNGLTILKQIAVSLDEDYAVSFKSKTFTPFTEKFADLCAGVYMTATIALESDVQCDSDTFDGKVITLSQNGIYDIIGYEKAIVNVIPKWGTIEGDINEQKDLQYQLSKKQDKLIAGDNVHIEYNDVIWVDDMRYNDAIGAFNKQEKLNNYLYSIEYDSIDYISAKEHFNAYTSEGFGHCSVLRKGNLFGRNYDYTINNQVEFVLKTKASGRLYSVTGIATAAAFTTSFMETKTYSEEYLYLPFRLVDGINEKGLVCNVNELPINADDTKNISATGNIPEIQQRESVPMIMLVRYILDRFEKPIEAADYIKNYVNIRPIIAEDGKPMNFHFCIADKYNTVYLYFYGNNCNYEVKTTGEDFVMTNFRLADTNLVDGHYSTTESNIESFGQGVERANALIDFEGDDLLDYLYSTVNFTKAYTTQDRLTDFAGIDDITIDNVDGLRAIQVDAATLYQQELSAGTLRTDADLWQTVHSVVYDINNKTIKLRIQEIENYNEVFEFNPYPRVDFEFTPDEIVPTTTNFVKGTEYSIYNALQRIANLFAGYWNYIQTNIMKIIPANATETNQLADKAFVNETVAQNAANFRGNWNDWNSVPEDAQGYPADYTGSYTPTVNDYLVVSDAIGYGAEYDGSWRFLYTGVWDVDGKSGWKPAYRIGSAFTDTQQAAIDSGINSSKVATYDDYENRIGAVETDKRDRIYTANKIYATDAEGKDIALELSAIQAHNYASLTNKPTINGVEVVGDKSNVDYNIYTKEATLSGNAIVLKANQLNKISVSGNTNISLNTTEVINDGVNIYDIIIYAPVAANLYWSDNLKWTSDVLNRVETGRYYEVNILNNLAIYNEWEG